MLILEMQKQMQKILLLFVTMAFEPVAGTYLCYQKKSCGRQSTCYQTVLRSQI